MIGVQFSRKELETLVNALDWIPGLNSTSERESYPALAEKDLVEIKALRERLHGALT